MKGLFALSALLHRRERASHVFGTRCGSRRNCQSDWTRCFRSIYLVFNEGYSAAAGAEATRAELTGEAIRLSRLLSELLPEPEVIGLLSLMLLQESRRAARTSPAGELILLENQDRSLWNREQIAEGVALVERALKSHRFGSYTLQSAIAARSCGRGIGRCDRPGGRLLRYTADWYEFSLRQL
jgi:predicted RNA polymerase sigma factor